MIPAILCTAVLLGIAVRVLRRRLAVVEVAGPSMQPALKSGDRVLVRRARPAQLRPGQVVVVEMPGTDGSWPAQPARWPPGQREWLIKRVAAVAGEPLPEPLRDLRTEPGAGRVPAGTFVVLGDNAAQSYDSRAIGCIPADRLLGIVVRPYWG